MPNYLRTNLSSAKVEDSGESLSVHLSKHAPVVNMTKHPLVKEDRYTNAAVLTEEQWDINFALTQLAQRRNFLNDLVVIADYDEVIFNSFTMTKSSLSTENRFIYVGLSNATAQGSTLSFNAYFILNRNGGLIYGELHETGQVNALILTGFIDPGLDSRTFEAAATGQSDDFLTGGNTKAYVLEEAPTVQ